jgi:hypothetical protein
MNKLERGRKGGRERWKEGERGNKLIHLREEGREGERKRERDRNKRLKV